MAKKKTIKPILDVISIGDATLDTFIEVDEATLTCSINKDNCQLCFNYADKIPISSMVQKVAGNAANVAIGTSRLGLQSAFWTVLGGDSFSDLVLKKMRSEKVSTKYVEIQKKTRSNFTVVLNYQGERTQLIYRVDRKYKLPKLEPAELVYLTAMGKNHEAVYEDLLAYLVENKARLAYNPGKEQLRSRKKFSLTILKYTEILFVNKEEATLLLEGREPHFHKGTKKMKHGEIKDLLLRLHELGPKIVVVTDGVNGSYVFAEHEYYYLPILEGPLKERTGAGDAYATGFISALLQKKEIKEAMAWGTINSWSVVQDIGPIDGLLKKVNLQKTLLKNKKLRGVKI